MTAQKHTPKTMPGSHHAPASKEKPRPESDRERSGGKVKTRDDPHDNRPTDDPNAGRVGGSSA